MTGNLEISSSFFEHFGLLFVFETSLLYVSDKMLNYYKS